MRIGRVVEVELRSKVLPKVEKCAKLIQALAIIRGHAKYE